jgi:hypothetical protein
MGNSGSVFHNAGFPEAHGRAFQAVADRLDRIIISRTRSPLSIQLLEEGYAAKGFGIKVKTCDWGPFLGFALADVAFSKLGSDPNAAQKVIDKSLHATAFDRSLTDIDTLYLSTQRLVYLRHNAKILFWVLRGGNVITCPGRSEQFELQDAGPAEPRWRLVYRGQVVKGLVNGSPSGRSRDPRKNCVTSDYDLWGVFPRRASQTARMGMDRQVPLMNCKTNNPVGSGIKSRIAQLAAGVARSAPERVRRVVDPRTYQTTEHRYREDPEFGNINFCTYDTAQALNRELRTTANYQGGNAVHHNDDLGNPFCQGLERQVIAFVPGAGASLVSSDSYVQWTARYRTDYLVYDNPLFM